MNFKKSLLSVAIATSMVGLTACGGGSDDKKTPAAEKTTGTLKLTNDNIYVLASNFPGTWIGNGDSNDGADNDHNITLEIEPGTLIYGSDAEALVVTRGSKIIAKGTKEDPIVFTSKDQFESADGKGGRGEWAGLALMGYAKSGQCGTPCNVVAEGNIGYYGGTNDADSSGELSYVVVRHAGNEIVKDKELNGLTLFATGSGTKMKYIQVHKGSDDGIEHFGSSDFMSHIVLTDNSDDSFDWGHGYTGGAQFMVVKQAKDEGDRAIEADNDKNNTDATPVSQPTLANITLIGQPDGKSGKADGILLRVGTGANIHNAIVTGFADNCIDIDTLATMKRAYNGTDYTGKLTIDNSFVSCTTNFKVQDEDLDGNAGTGKPAKDKNNKDIGLDKFDDSWIDLKSVADWFANSGAGNSVDTTIELDSIGMPTGNFKAKVSGKTFTAPANSGFVSTDYAGAFDPNATEPNWTKGWTVGLNGNSTVWEPAKGGTLGGTSPVADGKCPAGTKLIGETDVKGGKMDLCQLQRRYIGSDF